HTLAGRLAGRRAADAGERRGAEGLAGGARGGGGEGEGITPPPSPLPQREGGGHARQGATFSHAPLPAPPLPLGEGAGGRGCLPPPRAGQCTRRSVTETAMPTVLLTGAN